MKLYGEFKNRIGQSIRLEIITYADSSQTVEIGTEQSGIWFADTEPIVIESETEDGFDVLIRKSCRIHLQCREWMPQLFCADIRDSVVRIWQHDNNIQRCVFAGFIEPQAYNQDFSTVADDIEISCVDALGALQYRRYKGVGEAGVIYDTLKRNAQMRTYAEILSSLLYTGEQGETWTALYDGSKTLRQPTTTITPTDSRESWRYMLFNDIAVNEAMFLGDEEDDVWTQEEVLTEMLKYADLHIVQEGYVYYVFSWESIVKGRPIDWRQIGTDMQATAEVSGGETPMVININNVADTNTVISLAESYNQLLLTCRPEAIENVVESPLDKDSLEPVWRAKQKYLTEYSSNGEGDRALTAFYNMCHAMSTDWEGAWEREWYVRVKKCKGWKFPIAGIDSQQWEQDGYPSMWSIQLTDMSEHFDPEINGQHEPLRWLGNNMGACVMGVGSLKREQGRQSDNSVVSRVSMSDMMLITVNGDKTQDTPTQNQIHDRIPIALYQGDEEGGVYSPGDDETTNYIVVRGTMVLNPRMDVSATWQVASSNNWFGNMVLVDGKRTIVKTVPSSTHNDGRFYTRRYWKVDNETGTEVDDNQATEWGVVPFSGEAKGEMKYRYNSERAKEDTCSKVPVLACMLVIGDKCVVETGNSGGPDDYEWVTYKERSECGSDEEYFAQSFSIGFDPKIDDRLIGTEFDIQNNITFQMGLEEEGTAIPVHRWDAVSGKVQFAILGVVDMWWLDVRRRHGSFWRHTKWSTEDVRLLPRISSIQMKEFEIRVVSDNGGNELSTDTEIVYMSDVRDTYVNRKDDIEFKINSALTRQECEELGVRNGVARSVPRNELTGVGVLNMYSIHQNTTDKPERLYLDAHWREGCTPRVEMDIHMQDNNWTISPWTHFTHPALNKQLYVIGIGRDLQQAECILKLKETWQ